MSTKVLVADDSSTMRAIISRALNTIGVVDVVEVADGREAMKAFDSSSFDLVLTDWSMPNKTGIEVLREIRRTDAAIPVVMITSEGDRHRVLEAIEAGVSDYLLKPFTADDLKSKLESLLVLK